MAFLRCVTITWISSFALSVTVTCFVLLPGGYVLYSVTIVEIKYYDLLLVAFRVKSLGISVKECEYD